MRGRKEEGVGRAGKAWKAAKAAGSVAMPSLRDASTASRVDVGRPPVK